MAFSSTGIIFSAHRMRVHPETYNSLSVGQGRVYFLLLKKLLDVSNILREP